MQALAPPSPSPSPPNPNPAVNQHQAHGSKHSIPQHKPQPLRTFIRIKQILVNGLGANTYRQTGWTLYGRRKKWGKARHATQDTASSSFAWTIQHASTWMSVLATLRDGVRAEPTPLTDEEEPTRNACRMQRGRHTTHFNSSTGQAKQSHVASHHIHTPTTAEALTQVLRINNGKQKKQKEEMPGTSRPGNEI